MKNFKLRNKFVQDAGSVAAHVAVATADLFSMQPDKEASLRNADTALELAIVILTEMKEGLPDIQHEILEN